MTLLPAVVFLMLVSLMFGAFLVTPQARLLVDPWEAAARACGYRRKEIAAFQDLSEGQWRRQFEAEDGQHVSAYRMALAPAPVMREWLKRICPAFGLVAIDPHDTVVPLIKSNQELVDSNHELIEASRALLASIGVTRPLRVAITAPEREERTA